MQFLDDSLLPENQQPLVIQVAPYGPEWIPADSSDIPVSMDEQVQKAVDCYNAGATLLHVHVREADGKGSKRISMFNELLFRYRARNWPQALSPEDHARWNSHCRDTLTRQMPLTTLTLEQYENEIAALRAQAPAGDKQVLLDRLQAWSHALRNEIEVEIA